MSSGPTTLVPTDAVAGAALAGTLTGEMHASISGRPILAGGLLLAACLLAQRRRQRRRPSARGLAPRSPISRTAIPCGSAIARVRRRSRSSITRTGRSVTASELCEAIVEEIWRRGRRSPISRIEYVKVTSDDRIPAVTQNKIDLECGSTTANAERAKQVAFSPLMFVAGTKLMVPKSSQVSAVTDLKGKTVVVTKGTTNEQAMHNADKKFSLGLNIVTAGDHEESYQMLVDGKADAFATDDILLYGLIARHKSRDKFKVARRLSVLRSLRHHVPQGRAAAHRSGGSHLPQARFEPRSDPAL